MVGKWNAETNKVTTGITVFGPGTGIPLHTHNVEEVEETAWVQIVEWYDELVRLTDSPVARLNRAVAVGEAHGPRAGLTALARLDTSLPRYAAVHGMSDALQADSA